MNSLTYLLESLPWTIAGFLAGCLVTLKFRPTTSGPSEHTMPPPPKRRRFTLIHLMGLFVIALTIVSAVQSWIQSRNAERLTHCLVTYANATADSIEARSKASSAAQLAQDQMWRTILQQTQTDEGRAAARRTFEAYLDKREAATKAQQEHPYPEAPRDVCPDSPR